MGDEEEQAMECSEEKGRKRVMVYGANGRLGREVVRMLIEKRERIVLAGRNGERLREMMEKMEGLELNEMREMKVEKGNKEELMDLLQGSVEGRMEGWMNDSDE